MLSRQIIGTALFRLGKLVATPAALGRLNEHGIAALDLIKRHAAGDWGDLPPDDAHANRLALKSGARLFSAYRIGAETRIWVITEAGRTVTTVLLPSEYCPIEKNVWSEPVMAAAISIALLTIVTRETRIVGVSSLVGSKKQLSQVHRRWTGAHLLYRLLSTTVAHTQNLGNM